MGLMVRLIGSIAICLVYTLFYDWGDTLYYYNKSVYLKKLFFDDIGNNWILFFSEFYKNEIINIPGFPLQIIEKANMYLAIRIATFINIFLFDSFFGISLIFALWGFLGSWKLYKVFYDYNPNISAKAATFCLYLPSIVMWGSGIFKDTISFGAMGILIYCIYMLFIKRVNKVKYWLWVLVCVYLVGVVKAYILMALFPSIFFFIINQYTSTIKSTALKTIVFPVLLGVIVLLSFGALTLMSSTFTQYNLENLEKKAEGFRRWHTMRSEQVEGSGYTLPEGNILLKIPMSLNVTFFRPYLWETRKPLVLMAALESLYILIFTLNAFRKTGVKTMLKTLFTDPFASFCILFALAFGYAVGSTAYNFGALVRFKIPCLPFFMGALSLAVAEAEKQKSRLKKNS